MSAQGSFALAAVAFATVAIGGSLRAGAAVSAIETSGGVGEDTTPPVTTLYFNGGPPAPFFRAHALELTFEADDGADGSGVAVTEYRLNGDDWTTYEPFASPFLDGGDYVLQYRSRDTVGNLEESKEYSFTFEAFGDPGPPNGLALSVRPKRKVMRAGRRSRFRARVVNRGAFPAGALRVCARAPKRVKVNGPGCRAIRHVPAGATGTRAFVVRPKRAARGRRTRVRFTVEGPWLGELRATATLKVRR